jgi:predicted kinase
LPIFAILVGLPGSGKSTLGRTLKAERKFFVVSTDLLRLALNASEYPRGADYTLLDELVFDLAEKAIRWLLEHGHNAAIDATNVTRARRAEWREFARRISPGARVEIHWCTGKWDSAGRWMAERGHTREEYEAIRARLEADFEEPTAEEADALLLHGPGTAHP